MQDDAIERPISLMFLPGDLIQTSMLWAASFPTMGVRPDGTLHRTGRPTWAKGELFIVVSRPQRSNGESYVLSTQNAGWHGHAKKPKRKRR